MRGKRTQVSETTMLLEELALVPGMDEPPAAGSGEAKDALSLRLNRAQRSALCLSGGGIRSSSFCLGAMQQLAKLDVIDGFSFLSTVSGGGFAGSWLSSRRSEPVSENPSVWPRAGHIMAETESTAALRDVSRYLAMDANDTWELVGVFLFSLFINWLALLPLILAALSALMLIPLSLQLVALVIMGAFFAISSLYCVLSPAHRVQTAQSTLSTSLFNVASQIQVQSLKYLVVLGIGTAILSNKDLVLHHPFRLAAPLGATGLLGMLSLALQSSSLIKRTVRATGWWISVAAALLHVFLLVLAARLLFVIEGPMRVAAKALIEQNPWMSRQSWLMAWAEWPSAGLLLCLLLAVFVSLMFAWIDPNRISLHYIFRRRIGRAFVHGGPNVPMTGGRLQGPLGLNLQPGEIAPGLYPVINTTANDPNGRGSTQAERRGYSFVFTPLHCGFTQRAADQVVAPGGEFDNTHSLAATAADDKADPARSPYVHRTHFTSMAAALAVSGAAVSPQMGSFGSALLSLPLTLMNLRLGFWLPWPNADGNQRMSRVRFNFMARVYEAYPFLSRGHGHLYLTDGGHFDNLGLYEMVRRRCRHILVIDGGRDKDREFGSLANAIRRVRADFNVRIAIGGLETPLPIYRGTIYYSEADPNEENGLLVYIRPEKGIREPADVVSYAKAHPEFPNDSTADQNFGESQFESYRGLGNFIVADALQKYMNWKGPVGKLPETAVDMVRCLAEVASEMQRGIRVVERAGGLIFRDGNTGREVLLTDSVDLKTAVLPKGLVEYGEYLQETAVREIAEETGYRFTIDPGRKVAMTEFQRDGQTVRVASFHFDFDDHVGPRSEAREDRGTYWLPMAGLDPTKPVAVGTKHKVDVPPDLVQFLYDVDKALRYSEDMLSGVTTP